MPFRVSVDPIFDRLRQSQSFVLGFLAAAAFACCAIARRSMRCFHRSSWRRLRKFLPLIRTATGKSSVGSCAHRQPVIELTPSSFQTNGSGTKVSGGELSSPPSSSPSSLPSSSCSRGPMSGRWRRRGRGSCDCCGRMRFWSVQPFGAPLDGSGSPMRLDGAVPRRRSALVMFAPVFHGANMGAGSITE